MSEWAKNLLAQVAQEAWEEIRTHGNEVADVNRVLERRLLGLLEAGQELADYADDTESPWANWTAAKSAAMKEPG